MSLRSANIALGRLERGAPAAERPALWTRAGDGLDAEDARIPIDNDPGRRKLAAAERRYRRLRGELEGSQLSLAAPASRRPRQTRLP